ncbi:PXDN [Mytilus coruscus]|uniref:PXDN n=1 Tax=Mytilus coruscus TaxID=42192 RepID=A0A6J8DLQ1_MYTCO|nr:PXDN [Mytilus coruscus]
MIDYVGKSHDLIEYNGNLMIDYDGKSHDLIEYNGNLMIDYDDFKSVIRLESIAEDNSPRCGFPSNLPSPRLISNKLMVDQLGPNDQTSPTLSGQHFAFGQALTHDLIKTQVKRTLLKTSPGNNLPKNINGFCVKIDPVADFCQLTGDSRTDQAPSLQLNHLVLVREHNRIAKLLNQINSEWENDRVFEETPRIVIAEMQQITYNVYLPAILSPQTIKKNTFTVAPFRMGHSQAMREQSLLEDDYKTITTDLLADNLRARHLIQTNIGENIEDFIRWLTFNPANRIDSSADDIDLYVGGLLEKSKNGRVGETFACLIGKQFYLTKCGDRYWYERRDSDFGFTKTQLNSIKQMTMSKVLCENFGLDRIQQEAFIRPKRKRKLKKCRNLLELNLNLWKENTGNQETY